MSIKRSNERMEMMKKIIREVFVLYVLLSGSRTDSKEGEFSKEIILRNIKLGTRCPKF